MSSSEVPLRLTDTTFRDGAQSIFGGHLRGAEILPVARKLDAIGLFAIEAFGGASFETYLELGDDPWEHLRCLAGATPNTPLQALVRGQGLVGGRGYADDAVELFVATAAGHGVDVFRVFDPLNDLRNLEVAVRAARRAGRRVQGALCYAVSPAHDLEHWRALARGMAALGVDDLVIKDTSGLLGARAARELVTALREAAGLPVVVHSHCASGMAPMAYMAAVEAGAGVLDTAMSPLAWGASLPATESVVAALAGGAHDTCLDLGRLVEITFELEELTRRHREHLSPAAGRVDPEILRSGVPAPMVEDVRRGLERHNALDRLPRAMEEVARVRQELGYPPLVAPVRQVIAAQVVYNVLGGDRYDTVSQELKDYLQGLYGAPPVPADPALRRHVLGQDEPITIRPADLLDPQVEAARAGLRALGVEGGDDRALTFLMFPDLAAGLFRAREAPAAPAGEPPAAPAEAAPSPAPPPAPPPPEPEPAATSVATEFDVEVEGEVFRVRVTGAGTSFVAVPGPPAAGAPAAPAVPSAPAARDGAIAAPMQGLIVRVPVQVGDEVKLGDVVAVLEAMKMQNDIVATRPGRVIEVYVKEGEVVRPDQALVAVG